MTIQATESRNDYVGNGNVDTYNYTFKIYEDSDLLVTVKDTDDIETTLALSTDYTVVDAGEEEGGQIVLVNSSQDWLDAGGDLATGYLISIRRNLEINQLTDIRNQGSFFPEVHEDTFDRLTMIDQQQQEEINRSMKLSETVAASDFDPTLPPDILGSNNLVLMTNPSGTGLIMGPSANSISGASASAAAAAASAASALASEVASSTSEDNAAASAADALTSENAATAAQLAAEDAQTAAELAETNAEVAQAAAETAETNAETAQAAAAGSASAAATSATNSANSATASATSATNSSNSATAAAGSATAAATSATNAATSETNAAASASGAAAAVATHEADTTNIHGIADTSVLVTLAGSQSLSNKTLVTPTIDDALLMNHETTPANPAASKVKLYPKSDNKLYLLDSSGAETEIGTGAGGGGINYLSTAATAESAVTGWTGYADAAATPVDLTGGSPTATLARTTTNPLRGTGSFLLTPGALGNGFAATITPDRADVKRGSMQYFSFDYEYSATIALGAYTIWLYDVANSVLVQPVNYQLQSGVSGIGYKHICSFQLPTNATTFRVAFHQAVASPGGNLIFDNLSLGPQSTVYGTPACDLPTTTLVVEGSTSNPTKGTAVRDNLVASRIGSKLFLNYEFEQNVAGSAGSGVYLMKLPQGLAMDSTKHTFNSQPEVGMVGTCLVAETGDGLTATQYPGHVYPYDSTHLALVVSNQSAGNLRTDRFRFSSSAGPTYGIASLIVNFTAEVYISGWGQSVQMIGADDGRPVAATLYLGSNQSIASASPTKVTFDTARFDTHGGYLSNAYYIKSAGFHLGFVKVVLANALANERFTVFVYKNGASVWSSGETHGGSDQPYIILPFQDNFIAGDYLEVYIDSVSDTAYTVLSGIANSTFDIVKASGNSFITGLEKMYMKAGAATTSITAGNIATILFTSIVMSSHGVYSAATGIFTCFRAGRLKVKTAIQSSAAVTPAAGGILALYIYQGANIKRQRYIVAASTSSQFIVGETDTMLDVVAGDEIKVRVENISLGATFTCANDATAVTFEVSEGV